DALQSRCVTRVYDPRRAVVDGALYRRREDVPAGRQPAQPDDRRVGQGVRVGLLDLERVVRVEDAVCACGSGIALRTCGALRALQTLWPLWPLRPSLVPLNCFLSNLAGLDCGIDDPLAPV